MQEYTVRTYHGITEWRKNDLLHREDGPALEWAGGLNEWYKYGLRHREDGPAVKWPDGSEKWYQHGLLHRTDGPAVILRNEIKEWWLNGIRCTEKEFHYKQNPHHGKIVEIDGKKYKLEAL